MVEQLPKSIQQCHEEIIALREAYNTMLMDDMTSTEQGIDRLNIMPSASNFLSNNNVNKNNNSGNIKRNGRPSSNSIDDNLNTKLSSTQRQLGELKKRNKKLKEERDDYMKMAKELGGKDKKENLNLKLEQMTAKYQKMCSVKNLEISKLRSDNTRLKKVMTNLRLETEEQVQRALAQARMHKQKASQAASSQVRGSSGSSGKRHRGRQRTRSPPKSRKKKHNNADAIATHSDAINNNNNNNSPQYTMIPGEQVRNDPIKASLQKQKMKIISNGENPMKSGTPHYMMSLEHSNQNHLAIQQQERHDEIYNAERHHTNAAHHPNQQNQLYHQHQQHHQQQIQHNINNFNNADSTVTHAEHNVPPLPSDVNYPKGHELLKKSTSVADVMKTYNMNYDDLLLNNHHNIMHNPDEPRDMSQSRQDESPSPPPLLGNSGNAYDKYNIHVATESYSNFREKDVVKIVELNQLKILELFHGPTLAFKDIAMQLIGNMYEHLLKSNNETINIVVATSGDTGAAAIDAIKGKSNLNIFVLHPNNRISSVQRKIMTTVEEKNVFNIAIDGNFDDCQKIVKQMFSDLEFSKSINMSGVNSINWARIIAQAVYYFYAYFKLGKDNKKSVVNLLGSPSFKGALGDNSYYYIGTLSSKLAFLKQKTKKQYIIEIAFNPKGQLSDVYFYDKSKTIDVAMSSTETATYGIKKSFFQSLIDNFGVGAGGLRRGGPIIGSGKADD